MLLSSAVPFTLFVSSISAIPLDDCCSALFRALGSKVSYPRSAAYNTSVQSYWSTQEQQVAPSCIVVPAYTEDVSTAVKILTNVSNSAGNKVPYGCRFAIRSGGHTAQAGSANIQHGVTIDMSSFTDIILSDNRSLVTIGAGLRWGNVYGTLEPLGLAVTGGRVFEVGVGGLILGGGLSFFATSRGFSCDNVVSYEVVLSDGSVVNATSNLHHDLWLGLKGGSNNFGIVTKIVMRTFEQGPVWTGDIYNPISTAEQQFEALSRFISDPDYDENAALLHNWGFSGSQSPVFVNQMFYSKPIVSPPAFRSLAAIQPQLLNTSSVTSLTPYSLVFGALSPYNLQELTFSSSFCGDVATLHEAFVLWNASTVDVAAIPGIKWSMSLQPINSAITSKSTSAGGNSLGLPTAFPKGALVMASLSATWNDSNDNARVQTAADNLLGGIIEMSKARGTFESWIDLNHADTTQDPIASYGTVSQAKLIALSKKYDPHGVFQRLVPGGFKLST